VDVEDVKPGFESAVLDDVNTDRPVYKVQMEPGPFDDGETIADYFAVDREVYTGSEYRWGFNEFLKENSLLQIDYLPEDQAIVIGHQDDTRFGEFVTNDAVIAAYHDGKECPCHIGERVFDHGMRWPVVECSCGRVYIGSHQTRRPVDAGKITVQNPVDACRTEEVDGLVHASENWAAFWIINNQSRRVAEYLEGKIRSWPETWLWAHDGMLIAALHGKKNCLETTTVASGWRGDGHGTEFIKTWFEQFESDEIEIMHFGDTEPFIKQLDIPYTSYEQDLEYELSRADSP